jgi:ferric-dicitrate binding protein FerR (iron transport regulator)
MTPDWEALLARQDAAAIEREAAQAERERRARRRQVARDLLAFAGVLVVASVFWLAFHWLFGFYPEMPTPGGA